ncbi:hypothetical protein, conserved [Trypanosoma brucei gambiense DAL972]|uniref:Uncharacterized protein n=1 Tax=Trypanosoma brucei gambiense (strain MHOM/CI/86/DAL972) TaxID=679716 RepID=D0AAF0_TRYB9|nr:hypothetical protein, conserved [Trypanosoma brucei gambiense DAL972]CBH18651.1 hypothetical protein, conserved [Trypanosoma brucei gambiense DAL972]|eukprot:XP_011780915.1 hypothetical protein, conserved [Trypanosoma brucei gambiense DAL972]
MKGKAVNERCFKEAQKVKVAKLVGRYRELVGRLQLPVIDLSFYDACFVAPLLRHPKDRRLEDALTTLCDYLEKHRCRTVEVLELCERRDQLVEWLLTCCEKFEESVIRPRLLRVIAHEVAPIDDNERHFFHFFRGALTAHQLLTGQLVEGIFHWREQLTRPFAFNVSDENYIYRILEDCELLDASSLGKALKLRLSDHPLGAHQVTTSDLCDHIVGRGFQIPSGDHRYGCLTGDPRGCSNALVAVGECWRPSAVQQRHRTCNDRASGNQAYLVLGEAIIKGEHLLQSRLLDELRAMADNNRFLPMLSTPTLVTLGDLGLPLTEPSTKEWLQFVVRPGVGSALPCNPSTGDGNDTHGSRESPSQTVTTSSSSTSTSTLSESQLYPGTEPSSTAASSVTQ